MSKLLRHYNLGTTYFITCVTHSRRKLLAHNGSTLTEVIARYERETGVEVIAQVIVPDHFHMVVDVHAYDLSALVQRIKLSFSQKYRLDRGMKGGAVWQKRFWDHIIRDQEDLARHVDYIHYNPVKHGLVRSPFDWQASSIHEYAERGIYGCDWGLNESLDIDGEFGE